MVLAFIKKDSKAKYVIQCGNPLSETGPSGWTAAIFLPIQSNADYKIEPHSLAKYSPMIVLTFIGIMESPLFSLVQWYVLSNSDEWHLSPLWSKKVNSHECEPRGLVKGCCSQMSYSTFTYSCCTRGEVSCLSLNIFHALLLSLHILAKPEVKLVVS